MENAMIQGSEEILRYKGTPERPDVKIFVSLRIDQDSELVDCPLYVPVRCGAVYDKRESVATLGDDTGDNISEKRNNFCELTVMYWAWKNVEADYYGLCHYRRYFSFGKEHKLDQYSNVVCDYISEQNIKEFRLADTDYITNYVKQYDAILTTPFDISKAPGQCADLFEQYDVTPTMHIRDLETALDLLKEMYPAYYEDAVEYLSGKSFVPCQMFIMKKAVFDEYCSWLFPFLFELDKRLDCTHYCQEELRGLAHIAERLLGIYFFHRQKKRQQRIATLQRLIFFCPQPIRPPLPARPERNIPVVFASSDYYVPYLAVTIFSMLRNADKSYHYDLIVLTTDMGKQMEGNLRIMLREFPNCTLRILDVTPYVRDKHFIVNGVQVSKETFYRLMAPELFQNYERIVYLDSDLIVLGDIAELYRLPMGENLIAATKDSDFIGEYNGGIEAIRPYCDETLGLKDPYSYFQAGVVVFHVANMRRAFREWELVEYAQTKSFTYVDQDVLNTLCEGRVTYLPAKWNVLSDCGQFRVSHLIARAPEKIYLDYMQARKGPAIIHYAGYEKPWNAPMSDFADVFWQYARQTLFYEVILLGSLQKTLGEHQQSLEDLWRAKAAHWQSLTDLWKTKAAHEQSLDDLWYSRNVLLESVEWLTCRINSLDPAMDQRSGVRKLADKLLPKGSRRRKFAKWLLPKDSLRWRFCKKIYLLFARRSEE